MSTMREMSLEEVANQYGGTHRAAKEYNALRARVAELEARIAELQPMAECAAIMAVCGYFSRMRGPDCYKVFTEDGDYVYVDDGVPCCYPDPNITPLYAGSAPVPAVLQAVDVDVDAICNAYESGVGHRGRPTANVNPYREGTSEHEAYAIGAKGEAAQADKGTCPACGTDIALTHAVNMLAAKAKGGVA